jgi:hypothetical protein
MNKKIGTWERHSRESLASGGEGDRFGRYFLSQIGHVDLSGLRVVHSGLDTVRQLYAGVLKPDVLTELERVVSEGFGECVEIGGRVWAVGRGGKGAGYKYLLQDGDYGLIILVKSFYADVSSSGSHVKIECSPHWIRSRDTAAMGRELDDLARCFLDGSVGSGCAVHLCVDVQGWRPEAFLERLVTRSRRVVQHKTQKIAYMDVGEIGLCYGDNESFTLGSVAAVQMCVYRKDLEVKAKGRADYWHDVWSNAVDDCDFTRPSFNRDAPVWRIEFRFHHSVLAEFGNGAILANQAANDGKFYYSSVAGNWAHISGLGDKLQGLWLYGLDNFRLEIKVAGVCSYIDPVWQFLTEDVKMSDESDMTFKRVRRKPGESQDVTKNMLLAVGNLLSIYAKYRFTAKYAMQCLKDCGIYDDLYGYMARRAYAKGEHFDESDVFQFVTKALQMRTLFGKVA